MRKCWEILQIHVMLLILSISFIFAHSEPEHYDPNVQIVLRCIKETETSMEEMKMAEMPANNTKFDPEEKVLCLYKCLAEATRIIIDGNVHPENLLFFPLTPPNVDKKLFGIAQNCLKGVQSKYFVKTCFDMERVLTCIRLMFGSVNPEQKFVDKVEDKDVPKQIKSALDESNKNLEK